MSTFTGITSKPRSSSAFGDAGAHLYKCHATHEQSILSRLRSHFVRYGKIWAYVAVFIYSSLRALPLVFVDEFHGSIFVIWLIDIVTALPYTWGIIAFITSPRKLQRYCGFFIALATFAAPYIYFWTHGDTYPLGVIAIVVAMMIGGVGLEAYRYFQHKYRSSNKS